MTNLDVLDADIRWADHLPNGGYRTLARLGDTFILYCKFNGVWHATTSAMSNGQTPFYNRFAISPLPVGPGLAGWLERCVTDLITRAGAPLSAV